jgi:hypothetical protein
MTRRLILSLLIMAWPLSALAAKEEEVIKIG